MSEGHILLIALEYYLRKFYSITRDFARGKLQGPTRAILRYDARPPSHYSIIGPSISTPHLSTSTLTHHNSFTSPIMA
jgi:hypothetical protein